MTVSIWKALEQSAECVASALDMATLPTPTTDDVSLLMLSTETRCPLCCALSTWPFTAIVIYILSPPSIVVVECDSLFISSAQRLILSTTTTRISSTNCLLFLIFFLFDFDILLFRFWNNLGPPHISGSVTPRQTFRLGETIKLDCPIRGTPTPIVEWYKVNICYALHLISISPAVCLGRLYAGRGQVYSKNGLFDLDLTCSFSSLTSFLADG